jgi:hypothetical protein
MKANKEWDEMCPLCGEPCEYESEPCANEMEVWICPNENCEATIDVPITIIRHAAITVSSSKCKTQCGEPDCFEVKKNRKVSK